MNHVKTCAYRQSHGDEQCNCTSDTPREWARSHLTDEVLRLRNIVSGLKYCLAMAESAEEMHRESTQMLEKQLLNAYKNCEQCKDYDQSNRSLSETRHQMRTQFTAISNALGFEYTSEWCWENAFQVDDIIARINELTEIEHIYIGLYK